MKKPVQHVVVTVLQGASGGFGEYDWAECDTYRDCETLADYEERILADGAEFEITNELSGRIHREYGTVYKFTYEPYPDGSPCITYQMAWEEAVVA